MRVRVWLLASLLCLSTTPLFPQTFLRLPDTRQVARIDIDQSLVGQALRLMGDAFPNEAGMCFYGRLERQEVGLTLTISAVTEAASDSVSPSSRYWDPDGPNHGCPDGWRGNHLVGVGHSHPLTPCTIGSVSVPDLRALLSDSRVYFGSVWCFDGNLLLVWQGGWRDIVPYAHIQTPPS